MNTLLQSARQHQRINLAGVVISSDRIDRTTVMFVCRVLAPNDLRDREVRVELTHPGLWNYERAQTDAERQQVLSKVPAESFEDLELRVDQWFLSLMSINSVLLFQECLLAGDDYYRTWLSERVGDAATCDVTQGMSRIKVHESNGRKRIEVEILRDFAVPITTGYELQEFFKTYMDASFARDDELYENNAYVIFRITSNKVGQRHILYAWSERQHVSYVDRSGRERGFTIPATWETTWHAFKTGRQARGLGQVIAKAFDLDAGNVPPESVRVIDEMRQELKSGDITIDAIPGMKVRVLGGISGQSGRLEKLQGIGRSSNGAERAFYPMMVTLNFTHPESQDYVAEQHGAVVASRVFWDPDAKAQEASNLEIKATRKLT